MESEGAEALDCKKSVVSEILNMNVEDMMQFCRRNSILLGSVAAAGIGLAALKGYMGGGVCTSKNRLTGKTVVITGGNAGIGKETAKDLVRRGARVIIACRDITKGERAAEDIRSCTGHTVIVKVLDLASLDSVRKFSKDLLQSEKQIHILINNAGVMACPQWKSEDGYELQFATNHLGHFLLTNLLLDRIKASAPSRIINVSSLAHSLAKLVMPKGISGGRMNFDDINLEKEYEPMKAYRQSKLANVLFTNELHKRLQGTGVTVYSLHPGVIATNLSVYRKERETLVRILVPILRPIFFKTELQGAQTTIHCAVADCEEHSGKYFSDCAVKKTAPQAQDEEAAERLWKMSEEMTGLAKKS